MNELVGLIEIVAAIGLFVAPPILIVRLIAGSEPIDLADLFRVPPEATWPRVVQEEDPPAWRLERVQRSTHGARAAQSVAERSARPSIPVETGGKPAARAT